jgi:hypothetical protein
VRCAAPRENSGSSANKPHARARTPRAAQGLEKLGVGSWRDIRSTLLPDVRARTRSHAPALHVPLAQTLSHSRAFAPVPRQWDETALRIKASRLLGSQSLARYPGWKGDRAAVDAEQARNRALGDATGCWKSGVLVEDDHGSVAKAIKARDDGGSGSGTVAPAAAPAGAEEAARAEAGAAAAAKGGKRKAR